MFDALSLHLRHILSSRCLGVFKLTKCSLGKLVRWSLVPASSNTRPPKPILVLQASTEAKHHPALLKALAAALKVDASQIVDFDLNVCDTQPGVIGGEKSIPVHMSCTQAQMLLLHAVTDLCI